MWAASNGKLTSQRVLPEFGRGGEHVVYFLSRTQRYLKATLPSKQMGYGIALGSECRGAMPSEYLDRLDLQNCIFGDDIRLDRISENHGRPIIITSQPAIRGVEAPRKSIDEMMLALKYEKLADGAFYNGNGLLIFDLFPRNVIQVDSGEVFPIDPVIQRIDPEFGQFLRDHPDTINRGT